MLKMGLLKLVPFSIDPINWKATLVQRMYSGKVTPATVRAEDENGTKVTIAINATNYP